MGSNDILYDPFLPEVIADPFPSYHRLRSAAPVHLSPLGFWILTRYNDCMMVLRDPRFGREGYEGALEAMYRSIAEDERLPRSLLFRDPPDHTRLRGLVNRAFTSRVIEGLRSRIEQIVDGLLDQIQGSGGMEVIADLAYPLPVTVISEMLGVPERDRDAIKHWSADLARSLDAIGVPVAGDLVARGRDARRALGEYFRHLIPERRRQPSADLLSQLIAVSDQGDKLSEGELVATCVLLYTAGHETTVNLIGNGLLALLRHPAEMARLYADPGLIPSAVEEMLRYDGPVQRTARVAQTDLEIDGHKIAKGKMVAVFLGAANRDPAQFPDPDRLDVGRADNRHIAFGFGIHFCLGAPLARLEAQITFARLLRRAPRLALATETPEWRESQVLRGLAALPVTF
ncbi:MAG TPA: cytochrome P450 [Candidatus Methylomirabilis sp.]|nr:cytochrome P450 [Candidatus Methylomirabilis sp.]